MCRRYVPPGRKPGPGEQKLYVQIDGTNDVAVKRCKVRRAHGASGHEPHESRAQAELRRILEETTMSVGVEASSSVYGKYKVV